MSTARRLKPSYTQSTENAKVVMVDLDHAHTLPNATACFATIIVMLDRLVGHWQFLSGLHNSTTTDMHPEKFSWDFFNFGTAFKPSYASWAAVDPHVTM
jgi:hypothetical protein